MGASERRPLRAQWRKLPSGEPADADEWVALLSKRVAEEGSSMNGWLAIDPGVSGAVALVRQDGTVSMLEDMPEAGGEVDAVALAADLAPYVGTVHGCIIERVGAMPGQGVSSMFRFGRSVGAVEGVCGALRLPCRWVAPGVWKRYHGLLRGSKDDARRLAVQRWPDWGDMLRLKKHHGRADALLMAAWGVEVLR